MNRPQYEACVHSLCLNLGGKYFNIIRLYDASKTYQQNLKKIQKYLGGKGKLEDCINPSLWHPADIKSMVNSRRKLLKPPKIRKRILEKGIRPMRPSGFKWDNVILVGADTETAYNDNAIYPGVDVQTILLQLYHPSIGGKQFRNPPMEHGILGFIEEHCPSLFQEGMTTMFFLHNLSFDIPQLFGSDYKKLFYAEHHKVKKAVLGLQSFIIMKYKKYTVAFLDTSNFYPGTLESAAIKNGLPVGKQARPEWIGHYPQSEKQWREMEVYGNIDAQITYELGMLIQKSQRMANVGDCFTIAEKARKDFCVNYLTHPIHFPTKEQCDFLVKGKHGAIIMAIRRGFDLKRLYGYYDVNGLYTHIMKESPYPFSIGRTRTYEELQLEHVLNEEYSGVAKVVFKFPKSRKYPCLPVKTNKLYFPLSGVSTCTFREIRLAKKLGAKLKCLRAVGWLIDPDIDYNNPLSKYATKNAEVKDEMSRLLEKLEKEGKEGTPEYQNAGMRRKDAKDGNNVIYGKNGQITNGVAGSLYHPMFAPITLGHARCHMFEYLAKCEEMGIPVMYIDTDCLIAGWDSLPPDWLSQSKTGKLKSETKDPFHLVIIRSKFYFCVSVAGEIMKVGHHAIRLERNKLLSKKKGYLNAEKLYDKIMNGGEYVIKYTKRHFTKPRESIEGDLPPNKIIDREFTLSLSEDGKRVYKERAMNSRILKTKWIDSKPLPRV